MSDTTKADQSDVVANYQTLSARFEALEASLKAEQSARQNIEAQLKDATSKLSDAASKVSALEAKEADAAKRAAAAVATAGIVNAKAPDQPKPEASAGKRNWTQMCAAKLGKTLALLGIVIFGFDAAAQSAIQPNIRQVSMATFPTSVANGTTTTLTSSNVVAKLVPNGGVGLVLKFTGSGAGTSAVTIKFGISQNGTTVSTEDLATWVVNATGTTPVIAFTNIPPSFIGNAPYIAVKSVQNANANSITSVSLTAYTPPVVR